MKKAVITGWFYMIASVVHAGPSLCAKNEHVYFSCPANSGKTISLCGNVFNTDKYGQIIESDPQWLQYRYGSTGNIELAYPRQKKDSLSSFKAEMIRAQGGAIHVDAIMFVSGGVGYSVESVVPDTGEVLEGVSVGDPKEFGLETPGKQRREHYPQARILCAQKPDTKRFFDLVRYLDTP